MFTLARPRLPTYPPPTLSPPARSPPTDSIHDITAFENINLLKVYKEMLELQDTEQV